jgi:Ca-activated chloride channel family protein
MCIKASVPATIMTVLCCTGGILAQESRSDSFAASNIIMPQSRAFRLAGGPAIQITEVEVGVVILDQVATTTMDVTLRNLTGSRQQAELLVPVPDEAVVRGFSYQGNAAEATAQVLPKDDARTAYESIVAKIRDPALLEFVGLNVVRSSIFPVDANGTQKVRLTYEHLLAADGSRVDYVLPRSESLAYSVPWRISVKIKSSKPVSTVYSPSHELEIKRTADNAVSARIVGDACTQPGPFRLSYLLQQDKVTASLMAYPDSSGGGYFLLLAGLPARVEGAESAIKREITLVIDRSGSMQGRKIEQVRQAALQVLAGLLDGETFNVIAYNDAVEPLSKEPLANTAANIEVARAFVERLTAQGGTNLHDALVEALRPKPVEGALPVVLFLTDGLPTVGIRSEARIRAVAVDGNPYNRRVFTFGVGTDVNAPLLEKIAYQTRGTPTFVLPNEDVEAKVSQVYRRLAGPVLAGPAIAAVDDDGEASGGRVRDLVPAELPDLFEGDQLVLLGRYNGRGPLRMHLSGNYLGKQRTFRFAFDLSKATTRNSFVPRLWASRRIGVLVDAIRQQGGEDRAPVTVSAATADPRFKELVDEIIRLSKEFGILTEYTAFLAREGTDLSRRDEVLRQARQNFVDRGMRIRSGLGAVNQSANQVQRLGQTSVDYRNQYYDQAMNRVSIANVQQIGDRAFYERAGRWIDSRVVDRGRVIKPDRMIEFGSQDYLQLLRRLAAEGRQGVLSLEGDILIELDGQTVLIEQPAERHEQRP